MRLDRDGVRLAGVDFGGEGPGALLLHGLAGHAGEWAATARWLARRCRVVALDARGHGDSDRLPDDVSRAAHVADAAFALERLDSPPPSSSDSRSAGRRRCCWPPNARTSCAASPSATPGLRASATSGPSRPKSRTSPARWGDGRSRSRRVRRRSTSSALDAPDEWRAVVSRFLDALDAA